eukprot:633756-Pyramimonas_sp.AAC.1
MATSRLPAHLRVLRARRRAPVHIGLIVAGAVALGPDFREHICAPVGPSFPLCASARLNVGGSRVA